MKVMKNLIAVMMLLVAVALVGCQKSEKKTTDNTTQVQPSRFPEWVLNPSLEGGQAAMGSAKVGAAGISFARTEALANARDELARQLSVKVNNMFKSYTSQIGAGEDQTVDKVATNVSKQVASQTLQGSKQYKTWLDEQENELYVLVGITDEVVKTETKNAIRTSLNNEKALWQEFKSEKAQQQLDVEIEKMLKTEQNQ